MALPEASGVKLTIMNLIFIDSMLIRLELVVTD